MSVAAAGGPLNLHSEHESDSAAPFPRGEVHVWCCRVPATEHGMEQAWSVLSAAERKRVDACRGGSDRLRALLSRAGLRQLLARYTARHPRSLAFASTAHGKPYLASAAEGAAIQFNLSHADDAVVFAFSRDAEVGVDVERIRPIAQADEIAARFFSARERSAFMQAAEKSYKDEAFLALWTRKEAYLKAIGTGLGAPLASFSVPVSHVRPGDRLTVDAVGEAKGRWSFYHLRPFAVYLGAVAVRGMPRRLRYRECSISFE
jgi:4'-phosphopantetheinyl transferase